MKAAMIKDFERPLELQEVPVPNPGHGQVLVKLEASGLCHTDIHATAWGLALSRISRCR